MAVDLRHFRSFVVVAEEGNIGRAATRLFITRPEEVAALAVMLASDQLGNVTGENVVIDGGLIKTT